MKRGGAPTFVLTLPRVVKPGEDRILIECMEAGGHLNATLDEALRRHGLLKQSKMAVHPNDRRREMAWQRI